MKLQQLLEDVYAPLRGISDRTVRLYDLTFAKWGEFLGREPVLDDLEELAVAKFLAHRVRTREPGTAAKDRAQIRAVWEFAARRGLVKTWPTIPIVRIPERVPEAWLTDELRRLIHAATQERMPVCGIPGGDYFRALLLLLYDTGERITAARSIRWRDVRGMDVVFRAESRKGGRRDIIRPISEATAAALAAIRFGRGLDDEVFPLDRRQDFLWRRLGIILGRAGLPSGRKDKFHKVRKTTASYAQAAGLSAQQLLDHADPATTRKYLDPRIVRQQSAPDVLPKVS